MGDNWFDRYPLRAVCLHGQKTFALEYQQLLGLSRNLEHSSKNPHSTGAVPAVCTVRPAPPDIVVATPGRLVEHFDHTTGMFSGSTTVSSKIIQHTKNTLPGMSRSMAAARLTMSVPVGIDRYRDGCGVEDSTVCELEALSEVGSLWNGVKVLIVDESDRLLHAGSTRFQSWVSVIQRIDEHIIKSTTDDYRPVPGAAHLSQYNYSAGSTNNTRRLNDMSNECTGSTRSTSSTTFRRMRKWLFSASMTRSPEKVELLRMWRPLFILSNRDGANMIPQEMSQFWIQAPSGHSQIRLAVLLYLVRTELPLLLSNGNNYNTVAATTT
eukprot:Lankesteria_metandrocarpae@DN10696_c0_g1_i1.p1